MNGCKTSLKKKKKKKKMEEEEEKEENDAISIEDDCSADSAGFFFPENFCRDPPPMAQLV